MNHKDTRDLGNLTQQAAYYLGIDLNSPLSRADIRKLQAKKHKLRVSAKKAERHLDTELARYYAG